MVVQRHALLVVEPGEGLGARSTPPRSPSRRARANAIRYAWRHRGLLAVLRIAMPWFIRSAGRRPRSCPATVRW